MYDEEKLKAQIRIQNLQKRNKIQNDKKNMDASED